VAVVTVPAVTPTWEVNDVAAETFTGELPGEFQTKLLPVPGLTSCTVVTRFADPGTKVPTFTVVEI